MKKELGFLGDGEKCREQTQKKWVFLLYIENTFA